MTRGTLLGSDETVNRNFFAHENPCNKSRTMQRVSYDATRLLDRLSKNHSEAASHCVKT